METQSLKAVKKAPKRTALDTITNGLRKRRKSTKTERGKTALASSPVTQFTGGLVCELRIPVLTDDVSDDQDLTFSSLKSIAYGEGSETPSSLTIRGRDAAGTRREARVRNHFQLGTTFVVDAVAVVNRICIVPDTFHPCLRSVESALASMCDSPDHKATPECADRIWEMVSIYRLVLRRCDAAAVP